MSRSHKQRPAQTKRRHQSQSLRPASKHSPGTRRSAAAFRQRGMSQQTQSEDFNAPEVWREPTGKDSLQVIVQPAGAGYFHPVTAAEVRQRIRQLPQKFVQNLDVVQFSRMTRKRALFPCYGMQWGSTVYLYPIEKSLVETYVRPPLPGQLIEARMFGGQWRQHGRLWTLEWTPETIRDFYLNNVLIHEIGHIVDDRNRNFDDRERYANWFAVEYGYRCRR